MALGRDRPSVAPSRTRTGQGWAGALLASASCSVHTRSPSPDPRGLWGAVRVAGQRVRPLCSVSCEQAPCRAGKA